jgi:hypothetical protein
MSAGVAIFKYEEGYDAKKRQGDYSSESFHIDYNVGRLGRHANIYALYGR